MQPASSNSTPSTAAARHGPEALADIDRIRLVNPGFLEGSNVNAVEALTEMLSLARQYEMQVKLMKTIDENSEAAARLLLIS